MDCRDTAVALTGPGAAAIAVVRLSGPGVTSFLQNHFTKPVAARRCVHGDIIDRKRVIDDAVVVLAPDGAWADINLHGGPWVVQSFMALAARSGFAVIASPGFPLPEAASDAESPLDREILSHLPLAHTDLGVHVLLNQRAAWEHLKERSLAGDVRDELRRVARDATLRHLLNPPRVAIVGAANVGKSTLANQLFGQERSITADVAGTTRDWVGEVANIDGVPVVLLDTPGLRQTDDPIERSAIERSRSETASAALVVLVVDAARPLEVGQAELINHFADALHVINKTDRPAEWDISRLSAVRTVATTGEGVQELRDQIISRLCGDAPSPARAYCWTDRQQSIIRRVQSGEIGALHEI